ncbi:hypothetical protein D3C79_833580 [compost metagenome]
MAALSASRLVCWEMALMTLTTSLMRLALWVKRSTAPEALPISSARVRIAVMVRATRSAPLAASSLDWRVCSRVSLALRATSRMAADICSMAAARESMCWR